MLNLPAHEARKEQNKAFALGVTITLRILAAWLLYPLINLDKVNMANVL